MNLELTFLGTGTSAGVPMIACRCDVCRSTDPRDRRSRPSVLVRYPQLTGDGDEPVQRALLVDAGPDLREQAMRHDLDRVDSVLFTHAHADHVLGVDDLRRFNAVMKQPLNIYAERVVLEALGQMFSYIFNARANLNNSFVANLICHGIHAGEAVDLFGARWTPLRLLHGRLPILGFRVDWRGRSLAYCTDVSSFPAETYPLLEGLDLLVIDALRHRHHPTHLTVDQALEQIEQIRPGQAYFTHIAHDVSHAELETQLPETVAAAYDGLTVSLAATEPEQTPAAEKRN